MNKILFRVDGGKVWGISMGHIKRSLIIAESLSRKYDIVYLMKDYSDGVKFVRQAGFKVKTFGISENEEEKLIEHCKKYKPALIILDLYSSKFIRFFNFCRKNNFKTVVFDILGRCKGPADMVINDSFVKSFYEYKNLTKATTKLIGPKYFVIDKIPKIKPIQKQVKNLAITFGGSDPAGLTKKVLSILIPELRDLNLTVLLGPSFKEIAEIKKITRNYKKIKIYKDAADFLEILSRQDAVITAAGRTLYECAFLGRPVIIAPSIDHELVTANQYAQLTKSINVGLWNENSQVKIKNALNSLVKNYRLRKAIFSKSRKIIDGKGKQRVLKAIISYLNHGKN